MIWQLKPQGLSWSEVRLGRLHYCVVQQVWRHSCYTQLGGTDRMTHVGNKSTRGQLNQLEVDQI